MTIQPCILVINAGSSSVKFQLFLQHPDLELVAKGSIIHLGRASVIFTVSSHCPDSLHPDLDEPILLPEDTTHETALQFILNWIEAQGRWRINVVTHRVVHGGAQYTNSVQITTAILNDLSALNYLAPLHQPHNLAAINIISERMPDIIQIACFDTAFHANHNALFTQYALPQDLRDKGIRRYGFHGLSYEWLVHVLRLNAPDLAKERIVAAHLGNGASVCAIHNGISIDTTMGMTALDGLPMGSRCGNLDPGAVIYMIRELGLSPNEVEDALYNKSGLLGLSGLTNDVNLLQHSTNPRAQFALNYFCMRTAQLMGMMAVASGGINGLVFTGGIGEHAEGIRNKILHHLAFLRPFEVHIIPANEEWIMAKHSIALLKNQ